MAQCVVFGGAAYADDATAPSGSIIAVTTSLSGTGQDNKVSLVYNYKPYWDEVFDYAVEQDATGKLVPGLAESWEASADHLTWIFSIRQGVKWHNGDPLTAEDVAWSWHRVMFDADSKHTLSGYAPKLESITVEGNKVVIKTKQPEALVPLWFAKTQGNLGGTVVSKKYFETVGAEKGAREPIGTGPYKFVSANGEQSVQLTAFDGPDLGEWQKSRIPSVKDLTVMAVPEASTRIALLKTGGADLVPLPISAMEDVASQRDLRVISVPATNYSGIICMGFTLNPKSPCNDQKVREALSISIDRASIADVIYHGQAEPSNGWYGGPGSFGYPNDLAPTPFDPERAAQLLTEAGFGPDNPLKVQIVTYNDDVDFPMLPTLAEAIVGYYQSIGIDASIQLMDWNAQKGTMLKGEFTGQLNNPEVSPVTLFMRVMDNRYNFMADQIQAFTPAGKIGVATWDNAKLPGQAERLGALAAAFDSDEQEKVLKDYNRWMAENFNDIPLLAASSVFGVSPKLKSWTPIAGKPFVQNMRTLVPAED